jgi:hypothetical protein
MADTRALLDQLDAQIADLDAGVRQLTTTIERYDADVTGLRAMRKDVIRGRAEALLSDLAPATLARVASEVPGFVTAAQVQGMIERAAAIHEAQLTRLLASYDPAGAEAQAARLASEVARAETDALDVKQPYGDVLADGDVTYLVGTGYGTDAYRPRWWHFFGTFYSDWKKADEVALRLKAKSWAEIAAQHEAQTVMRGLLVSAREKAASHDAARAAHADLLSSIARAPETVLEQLRVKMEAWIDSQDPPPPSIHEIAPLGKQIEERQREISALQGQKTSLSGMLVKLQEVRSRAARSKKQSVPDQYLEALRASRQPAVQARGWGGSPVVVHSYTYVHDNDFFDGVMYGQMSSYFAEDSRRHARQAGYNQGYSDRASDDRAAFAAARADTSGQS